MYSLVTYLLEPYTLCLLGLAIALLRLRGSSGPWRRRWRWAVAAWVLLVLLSLPAVEFLLLGSLEWQYPSRTDRPGDVQAIVVLGSGVIEGNAEGSWFEVDPIGQARTTHAARCYHQGRRCLVLATGGKVDPSQPGPPCAEPMGDLLRQLGVHRDDVLIETESRTTFENARESARLLAGRGVTRILLVSNGWHLARAVPCFQKQGLGVVTAGCQYEATVFRWKVEQFLPRVSALSGVTLASHEWLGIAWYWLRGRI